MLKVNGKSVDMSGKTLKELLVLHSYNTNRIAVEHNGEIVPKSQYDKLVLSDGDSIEVVSFVGGG